MRIEIAATCEITRGAALGVFIERSRISPLGHRHIQCVEYAFECPNRLPEVAVLRVRPCRRLAVNEIVADDCLRGELINRNPACDGEGNDPLQVIARVGFHPKPQWRLTALSAASVAGAIAVAVDGVAV